MALEELKLRPTSAKVEVEVEAELGKSMIKRLKMFSSKLLFHTVVDVVQIQFRWSLDSFEYLHGWVGGWVAGWVVGKLESNAKLNSKLRLS